ncbi:MAG TPA: hypothetical protein PK563_12290 [Tenuifilaceae bacterium]|nr:hypothetical protein [Tenuifilaceae bacterium]
MNVYIIANPDDLSTFEVVNWINIFGYNSIVLNFSDLVSKNNFEWDSINQFDKVFNIENKSSLPYISVWFRSDTSFIVEGKWLNNGYSNKIKNHLFWEIEMLKRGLFNKDNKIRYLSYYQTTQLNKLTVLNVARKNGLTIPKTIITTSKNNLYEFKKEHNSIIGKAVFENISHIKTSDGFLKQFVKEINSDFIDNLPEHFFPSFFQKLIPKEYDVRVFYLNGKCYPMAIFSKAVDFRADYDTHRNVPMKLPKYFEKKICKLMDMLELNTGSLDFVKSSEDGKFYFLEVNPNGQFGMVSEPCNYYIEREIAKFLCNEE